MSSFPHGPILDCTGVSRTGQAPVLCRRFLFQAGHGDSQFQAAVFAWRLICRPELRGVSVVVVTVYVVLFFGPVDAPGDYLPLLVVDFGCSAAFGLAIPITPNATRAPESPDGCDFRSSSPA